MVALKKAYESKHCEFLQAVSLNRSPTCCFSPSERFGRRRREVAWRDHRLLSFSSPSENHIGDAGMKPLLDELEKKGSSLNELSLSRLLVSLFSPIENGLSQSSLDRIGQLLGEGKLDNLIALDLSCNASSSR